MGETPLPLTRSEYAICEYLALHAGQTFTKEQIYEAVFGIDDTADDTAVTQHIKNIRAKLRAAGVPEPGNTAENHLGSGISMEKRGLISLQGVLLRYLVQTVFCCVLALLLWFAALMCVINSGLALPANQAAQACQKAAQDVLPGMTAATFDETQLDSLCRYALFAAPDSSEVLATNMDAGTCSGQWRAGGENPLAFWIHTVLYDIKIAGRNCLPAAI